MEPEAVIPMNNRLRQIEVEIEEEIERLLTELSIYLSRHASEFSETKTSLLSMDYLLSLSQLSLRLDAKRFQFSSDRIRLQDIKHPLMVMAGKDVIANTVELNHEKSVLLLSGPNAGGKTVLLKSVGLAAQIAVDFLCVPMSPRKFPFFDIFTLASETLKMWEKSSAPLRLMSKCCSKV
jgi:DNA mismatch repair protein MutS2